MKRLLQIGILSLLFLLNYSESKTEPIQADKISINDSLELQQAISEYTLLIQEKPQPALDNLYQLKNRLENSPLKSTFNSYWLTEINLGLMKASKKLEHIEDAIRFANSAIKLAEKDGQYSKAQSIRVMLGELYYIKGDKLKSLNCYYQALNNWDGLIPEDNAPMAYLGIAHIHLEQKTTMMQRRH